MQNWFIIQEGGQQGPYSLEALHKMYYGGEIHEETHVWRQGLKVIITVGDLLLEMEDSLPPELPIAVNEITTLPKSTNNKKKKIIASSLIVVVSFILLLTGLYNIQGSRSLSRPSGMTLKDFDEAKAFLEDGQSSFYISKDRRQIFFIHPSKTELTLGIKIDSVVRNSLAQDPVEASSVAKFNDHLAIFENLKFLNGDHLVEGEYKIELSSLESKSYSFPYSLLNEVEEINFTANEILSTMATEDFSKEVEKFWKVIRENEKRFWIDLREQYQTLAMIVTQIRDSLEEVFILSSSLTESVKRFEKNYKEKFGLFFTSFVISNDENTEKIAKQEFPDKPKVLAHYAELSRMARQVGSETMSILHDLETFKDYKKLNDSQIKIQSLSRLGLIIEQAQNKEEIVKKIIEE